jgi:hypothetical protein
MAHAAKITLSAQELQLLQNKDWILTKRIVIDKADALLADCVPGLRQLVAQNGWLPPELAGANPKIYRGENYRGLPYVLLDCPAVFGKAGNMAIRTMLWWGHGFSVTLQLSGRYKALFEERLLQRAQQLQVPGLLLCTGTGEWEHHFEADNYTPSATMALPELLSVIRAKDFVKTAVRFRLDQWAEMPLLAAEKAGQMLGLIGP